MAKKQTKKRATERAVDPTTGLPVLRIGIYARVSTERQAQTADGSIETQVDRLERYIAFANESPTREYDYRLAGKYIDPGHSAKNLDRPDISRLQADIKAGVINCVAVTKIDRITRSLADFMQLDAFFREHGTALISLDDRFDTSTAMGRAMQQLLIVFAELERQLTAERTGRQMQERAIKGLYNGGYRPWGYNLNSERRGVPLVDRSQKAVLLWVFRRYRSQGSLHDLQRWMYKKEIRRPEFESRSKRKRGGTVPDVASLTTLLSNDFYIGKVGYKGQVYDGIHVPLFKTPTEVKLWDAVQKKLASRSPKNNDRATRGPRKVDAAHVFVLNSLLSCSLCGSALTHDSGTGRDKTLRHYYTCVRRKKHGKERCSCPSLPAEAIEDAILSRLKSFSVDEASMHALLAKADAGKGNKVSALAAEESRVRRKLTEIDKQISNIMAVLRDAGAGGFATIKLELARLEKERGEAGAEYDALHARIEVLQADQLPDGMIVEAYRRLGAALETPDRMALAKVLPAIIRQIIWHPATDGTRGGRYQMTLWPTPLIPETLGSAEAGDAVVGSDCSKVWLPVQNPPRTISGPDLEYEAELFGVYERRRLKLVFKKPSEKAYKYGVNRRWLRNPIIVAREIAAEMDSTPGATQETVGLARGVTRTRICQYLRLLLLPTDILDFICDPTNEEKVAKVTEGSLRHLLREPTPVNARRAFYAIVDRTDNGP